MERYVVVDKREGETPLSALERYRATRPELAGIPMTYAGRLDPMARGMLVILLADACTERDVYTGLDKEYEFEVLYGVATDTGDIAGLIREVAPAPIEESAIAQAIEPGAYRLQYPAFSSKTVRGIPLFQYALRGELDTIDIPETDMTIRSLSYLGIRNASASEIRNDVKQRLGLLAPGVVNNFRKPDVLHSWSTLPEGAYVIAKYCAVVSSGTYIRVIAEEAGRKVGIPALAYSIHRTRIFI